MTSSSDVGTIFQLRNIINRKHIGSKPKKNVNAFFQQIVESHVLATAMEYLGMESIEDQLSADIFSPTLWMVDREERYENQSYCQCVEPLLRTSLTFIPSKPIKRRVVVGGIAKTRY